MFRPFRDFIKDYDKLPFGAIIGQAWLKDTHRVETFTGLKKLTDQERAFGDYSAGRYGWELTEATQFPIIIPAKGALGIWDYKMPDKIGCYLANGAHASFDGMPDKKTIEAVEVLTEAAKNLRK